MKIPNSPVFGGNPYDVETFFKSLSIAETEDKNYEFVDQFISKLKEGDVESDVTSICFNILKAMNVLSASWNSKEGADILDDKE